MPSLADHPAVAFLALLAWVVVLVVAIDRADRVVPRGSRLESAIQQWTAAAQAVVVVGGVLGALQILLGSDTITWRWLTVGLFVVVCWSARHALTDWANGVMLRSEGTLRIGARIGVGAGRGRIRRMGLRSAEVEAEDGRLLRLPFTTLAKANIEISPEEVSPRSHTFTLRLVGTRDVSEVSERIVSAALLSPWSSAEPTPAVRLVEVDDRSAEFEVTVYPVDPAFASNVEGSVRENIQDDPEE
ncbi:MAG: mechanosensitive ion channel family protein [Gemmatimonadota bacterium]|nr:mechanosensitive ion channel family protein [Gemmatimonadota bacterium]